MDSRRGRLLQLVGSGVLAALLIADWISSGELDIVGVAALALLVAATALSYAAIRRR